MGRLPSDQRPNDARELGALVARERKRRGLSRAEFAALCRRAGGPGCRINDRRVESWERGLSYPQPAHLRVLARAMGMEVEQLAAAGRMAAEDEDTRRREFLLLALGTAAMVDVERLVSPSVDAAWLRDAETVSMGLAEQLSTVAPASLLPAVLGHLSALEARLPATTELTARTAHLAGSLLGLAGYPTLAWRSHALAETLGDTVLRARAMTGKAAIHQRGDDVRLALALQDAAVAACAGPMTRVHAGTLARRAELRALTGDDVGAMRDLEDAATALEAGEHLWYLLAPKDAVELGAYRGSVAATLGRRREALEAYDWTLNRMNPALLDWRGRIEADRNALLARLD